MSDEKLPKQEVPEHGEPILFEEKVKNLKDVESAYQIFFELMQGKEVYDQPTRRLENRLADLGVAATKLGDLHSSEPAKQQVAFQLLATLANANMYAKMRNTRLA